MKKSTGIWWAVSAFFFLSAVVFCPSWASLLLLLAGLISLPITPVRDFLSSRGLRGGVKIAVVVALLIAGAMIAPAGDSTEVIMPPETPETTASSPVPASTPSPSPEPTPQPTPEPTPAPTPTAEPQELMVWISQNGSRYHRDADCSGMNSPTQVTLTEAQSMGLTACGRCW